MLRGKEFLPRSDIVRIPRTRVEMGVALRRGGGGRRKRKDF